jgi:hypothetical protein
MLGLQHNSSPAQNLHGYLSPLQYNLHQSFSIALSRSGATAMLAGEQLCSEPASNSACTHVGHAVV